MNRAKHYSWVLLVVVAIVVNRPIVQAAWVHEQIERHGVDVTLTGVSANVPEPLAPLNRRLEPVPDQRLWVVFRLPQDVDPDEVARKAEVNQAAWNEALETGELDARVVAGDPPRYQLEGQVTHRTRLLVWTLAADLGLAVLFLLGWRRGTWRRSRLKAVALDHVVRRGGGTELQRVHGDEFVLRGEVREIEGGRVLLDLGSRTVEVELDGHSIPVRPGQTAEVRARLL